MASKDSDGPAWDLSEGPSREARSGSVRLSAKVMWRDNDVRSHGEAVTHIRHAVLGPLAFEYSAFAVDGRPDLSMVVYNPATPADAEKIKSLTGSEICGTGSRSTPGSWRI
jgi:hypothetical protein